MEKEYNFSSENNQSTFIQGRNNEIQGINEYEQEEGILSSISFFKENKIDKLNNDSFFSLNDYNPEESVIDEKVIYFIQKRTSSDKTEIKRNSLKEITQNNQNEGKQQNILYNQKKGSDIEIEISIEQKKDIESNNSFSYNNNNTKINKDIDAHKRNLNFKTFELKRKLNKSFNSLLGKKRGKKSKQSSTSVKRHQKTHDKNSFDNIISKYQIHYIDKYLRKIVNKIIFSFSLFSLSKIPSIKKPSDYFIRKLDHEETKKVNKDIFKKLKEKSIKDILSQNISKQNKKWEKNLNQQICEEICENNVLAKNFLEKKYLYFFRNYRKEEVPEIKKDDLNISFCPGDVEFMKDKIQNDFCKNPDYKKKVEQYLEIYEGKKNYFEAKIQELKRTKSNKTL